MNLYEELNVLEDIPGSNDKENQLIYIIENYPEAEDFLRFTFNDIKYGVQEQTFKNAFSLYDNTHEHISDWFSTFGDHNLETEKVTHLIEFGKLLCNISGQEQERHLRSWFHGLQPLKKKWFCRAILKDLRCGVGLKTVNNVFKSLSKKEIPKFALQLCAKTKNFDLFENADNVKKKIKFPCSMECKYDGIRLQAEISIKDIATWTDDPDFMDCILTSRRGTDRTADYPEIVQALKEAFVGENVILDGEIISRSFQELTQKDSTAKKKYVVFDMLNDEELPYINRWDNLRNLFISSNLISADLKDNKNIIYNDNHIVLAEHYNCNSLEEAQEYYNELNKRGEEGLIIKSDNKPYKRGSRTNMFKFKKVYTADLLCYGFEYGAGARTGKVSTLKLKDKSGKILADVGTGLSDDMIEELTNQIYEDAEWDAEFLWKIVEVAYNEITETGSLRFPRFICFRDDKTEADDLSDSEVRQA